MSVIKAKRGTTAEWETTNHVLADGEKGVDTDTGFFKLGDGVTPWLLLPYFAHDEWLKANENKWFGHQFFTSIAKRFGNEMDLDHHSLHPSARPRTQYFDGNSHPIGSYFSGSTSAARLANAQLVFPFVTNENDEADWVAIQGAVLGITAKPKGWGKLDLQDWRQYGAAKLTLPNDAFAIINRPIVKAANSNQNFNIGSSASQGARLDYTGTDGQQIFILERDGVGSSVNINNMVLNGGGVLLKGPYRGDIRVGDGMLIVDTPHPAILAVDTDKNATPAQVGVVGLIVQNLITHGCAGSVWQHSSTADITCIRDSRAIANLDVGYYIKGTTDAILENLDVTGIVDAAAALGKSYIQISAETDTTNNINLDDIRYGSEAFNAGTGANLKHFGPPRDFLIIGELDSDTTQQSLAGVTLRKQEFRSPITVTSSIANSAIRINAKVYLDIDECDFGEFYSYLVHEDYLNRETVYMAGGAQSIWGDKNTIDPGHKGRPIFSHKGVGFGSSNRQAPLKIDRRATQDYSSGDNLVSTDLSTWTLANATISALQTGGMHGSPYYTITKSAAAINLSKALTLTAGKSYTFGISVRRGTGQTIRSFRARCAVGVNPTISENKQIRITDDWVTYLFRIEYVPTTASYTFSFFLDNDEETSGASGPNPLGTVDVCLPWVSQGLVPRIPKVKSRLTLFRAAPTSPIAGDHFLADGVNWDPDARALGRPYEVLWDGTAYRSVSSSGVAVGGGATVFQSNNATTVATPTNSTTDTTLATHTNIPASSLHVGDRIKVKAQGNFDAQANPGAFNLRTRVNGTAALTSGLVTAGVTNAPPAGFAWHLEGDLIITALGSGGGFRFVGKLTAGSGATNTTRTETSIMVDVAQDLTAGLQVSWSASTATASATNTIRHHASSVEKV